MRPALCDEALRLGRMLAELAPQQAEVQGLVALMEIQASRTAARTDAEGRPVLLPRRTARRWDRLLIRRGLAALERAEALARRARAVRAAGRHRRLPRARAHGADDTDWARISALYADADAGGAVAGGRAQPRRGGRDGTKGRRPGWPSSTALRDDKALRQYQWLPSVRGDLLAKLGRRDEARAEFEQAATLAGNEREKALLLERADTLRSRD